MGLYQLQIRSEIENKNSLILFGFYNNVCRLLQIYNVIAEQNSPHLAVYNYTCLQVEVIPDIHSILTKQLTISTDFF